VDVGAKRDGLVHVKDISKNYFIENHQSVGFLTILSTSTKTFRLR
jgi:hypothetical protein